MRKIIVDTDPGIDDAVAIIATFCISEFDILGITVVHGNVPLKRCEENALGLIQFLEKDVPVYAGAECGISKEPDLSDERASVFHGKIGLGGVELPYDIKSEDKHAVDFILECAEKYPDELEIITLGPYTNIAMAIDKNPKAMKQVKTIWSMGGGNGMGNVTKYAEFNFWADSAALKTVLEFGKYVDIYMYPINVTHQSPLRAEDLLFIGALGGKTGKFILDINLYYVRGYLEAINKIDVIVHDLLTVMCAYIPEICSYKRCYVEAVTEGEGIGKTICHYGSYSNCEPNVNFAVSVDVPLYRKRFIETVFPDSIEKYLRFQNA